MDGDGAGGWWRLGEAQEVGALAAIATDGGPGDQLRLIRAMFIYLFMLYRFSVVVCSRCVSAQIIYC